jgi:hypothetical protein
MVQTIREGWIEEGKAKGALRVLIKFGKKRLGEPAADVLTAMQSITDVDRLDRLGDHLDQVSNWEELLQVP